MSRASAADRLGMLARDQPIEAGEHAVPVVEQIEGDDRRHHDEADDADERPPAGPDGGDDGGDPGRALRDDLVDVRRASLRLEELADPGLEEAVPETPASCVT